MIRIDLTTSAVTVEGDGSVDHLITVRTLRRHASRVELRRHGHAVRVLDESIRTRNGSHVLREYDLDEPGNYTLTSGRRELSQNRTFEITVSLLNTEIMRVDVLPSSFECAWVVEDQVHQHRHGDHFQFDVRITTNGVAQAEGEIARMESFNGGVRFERATAWARLMKDDDADSV
jgi:hypothetical protein